MVQVSTEDAVRRLPSLLAEAMRGETVLISTDEGGVVQLVAVAEISRRPQFGSAKGLITIADDFDAPLEGLDEYMP